MLLWLKEENFVWIALFATDVGHQQMPVSDRNNSNGGPLKSSKEAELRRAEDLTVI